MVYKSNFHSMTELKHLDEMDSWSPCFGSSTIQCRHISWFHFETKAQSKARQDGPVTSFTASILTRWTIYKAVTSLHLIGRKKLIPPSDPMVMDADWPVGSGSVVCVSVYSLSPYLSPYLHLHPDDLHLHCITFPRKYLWLMSRAGEGSNLGRRWANNYSNPCAPATAAYVKGEKREEKRELTGRERKEWWEETKAKQR